MLGLVLLEQHFPNLDVHMTPSACRSADSDSVGLRVAGCSSNQLPGVPMLLVQAPHFEK